MELANARLCFWAPGLGELAPAKQGGQGLSSALLRESHCESAAAAPFSQGQHPDLAFPPLDVNHEDRAGRRAEEG